MPNQRKKGLKLAGAYITTKAYDGLKNKAKAENLTVAEYLRKEIDRLVEASSRHDNQKEKAF